MSRQISNKKGVLMVMKMKFMDVALASAAGIGLASWIMSPPQEFCASTPKGDLVVTQDHGKTFNDAGRYRLEPSKRNCSRGGATAPDIISYRELPKEAHVLGMK